MELWLCDKCGCEINDKKKPTECPLCKRSDSKFMKIEKKDPNKEDELMTQKYDKVIEKLEDYNKDCEPEQAKYSLED